MSVIKTKHWMLPREAVVSLFGIMQLFLILEEVAGAVTIGIKWLIK